MGKEKLIQLEEKGEHLFHGSPDKNIKVLEPRQSVHYPDLSEPEKFILDGNPAVSATPYSDIAIFRSLINKNNIGFNHSSSFGVNKNGDSQFGVSSKDVLSAVKDKKGYVYVFKKDGFYPYNRNGVEDGGDSSMEWRSENSVEPVDVIEVGPEDLPHESKIKIGE